MVHRDRVIVGVRDVERPELGRNQLPETQEGADQKSLQRLQDRLIEPPVQAHGVLVNPRSVRVHHHQQRHGIAHGGELLRHLEGDNAAEGVSAQQVPDRAGALPSTAGHRSGDGFTVRN